MNKSLMAVLLGLIDPRENDTPAKFMATVVQIVLVFVLCMYVAPQLVVEAVAPESTESVLDVLDVQTGTSEAEVVPEAILVRPEPEDDRRGGGALPSERIPQTEEIINSTVADPVDKDGNYPVPEVHKYVPPLKDEDGNEVE